MGKKLTTSNKQGRRPGFQGDERGQTALEYILLVAAVILFAVIVIVFANNSIFGQGAQQGQKYAQGITNLTANNSNAAG